MTPDHTEPNRAAPETYDRDWFLAQLNGRDPAAPRASDVPADDSDADVIEPEPVAQGETTEPEADETEDAALTSATAKVTTAPADDDVFPPVGPGSRGRRVGALVGASAGLVLVASIAFAASGMHDLAQPAGAENPATTSLPAPAQRSKTPVPQLSTLPIAGDAPRNSGYTSEDEYDSRDDSPPASNHGSDSPSTPPTTDPSVPPVVVPPTDSPSPSDPPVVPTDPPVDPPTDLPVDPPTDTP